MVSAALVMTLVCFVAAPSEAGQPGRAEFERASRYYRAQEYEAALPLFQEAYRLSGHRASTVRALAQCERSLKMYPEAIAHFREYLATRPPDKEAKAVEKTIALLEELAASRAALAAEAAEAAATAEAAQKKQDSEDLTPPIGEAPPKPRAEVDRPPANTTPSTEHTPSSERTPSTDLAPRADTAPNTSAITRTETSYATPESRSTALPWLTISGGSALAIFGATMFVLGVRDVHRVENSADGVPYRGDISDAADRAPTYTGIGIAALITGAIAASAGAIWLAETE